MADALTKKHDSKPIMADIYTLGNMKIILDDLLNEYLISRGFKRNYAFPDFRTTIGLISTVLAIIVTYLSLYYKFDDVSSSITFCIFLYFVLNAFVSVIGYFEEHKIRYGTFYLVTKANIAPSYTIEYFTAGSAIKKYTKSLYDLFDSSGRMDHVLFINDMEDFFNKE
ncbi:signal peptidase complex subunit 2 [Pancytospora epiphaga]|nr:signal peptidase complex subunit 2 [Pancytospora epiphaga]